MLNQARRAWFHHRAAAVWFGVACTFISWAGLASYWGTHRLIRSFNSAAESHRALEELQTVQTLMESAESAVDQYVITGMAARLAPFQEADRRVPKALEQMEALVSSVPAQRKDQQQLQRMTLGHLTYLRNVVRVRRTRGFAAAAAWVRTEASSSPRALTQRLLGELQHRPEC